MGKVRCVILGEDQEHGRFARRLLIGKGLNPRDVRILPCAGGKGDGKHEVKRQFAPELHSLRAKRSQDNLGLVVLIDADNLTLDQRRVWLHDGVNNVDPEIEKKVCILIPKWCIETWIVCLINGIADEEEKTQASKAKAKDLDPKLACKKFLSNYQQPPQEWVPSLREGAGCFNVWLGNFT